MNTSVYDHFMARYSVNTTLRLSGIALVCCLFLLSACTTVPIEKPAVTKPNITQDQQQRFQQAKQLYLSKQYAQAAELLLPLAQQGHLDAQYTVGYMYHYGYGLPRNEKESTRWIATAAARGNAKAQEALKIINEVHDLNNPPPSP